MNWLELLGFGPIIDFEKEDEGMEKEEIIERLVAFRNGWENPKSATPDFWEEVIEVVKVGNDAISRQAAIDAFNAFADEVNQDTDIHEAIEIVLNLPPVEQKQGKWIKVVTQKEPTCEVWHFECSECGEWEYRADFEHNKYCPNCGAKMCGGDGE